MWISLWNSWIISLDTHSLIRKVSTQVTGDFLTSSQFLLQQYQVNPHWIWKFHKYFHSNHQHYNTWSDATIPLRSNCFCWFKPIIFMIIFKRHYRTHTWWKLVLYPSTENENYPILTTESYPECILQWKPLHQSSHLKWCWMISLYYHPYLMWHHRMS